MQPPPTVPLPRPWWKGPLLRFAVLIAAVAVAAVLVGSGYDLPVGFHRDGPFLGLAGGLGVIVGASEIISRYRDEPWRALNTVGAVLYVALNGLVSAAVYALLTTYASSIFPGLAGDRLMTSLVAGLAAMGVLRSRIFTLRTEAGEDIAVGPDAAVTAFLNAADRAIDRKRASRRMSLVFNRASDRKLQTVALSKPFLEIALAAMQNVPKDEKQTLVAYLQSVADDKRYPEDLKLQAMCYALLGVTGERNFDDIMTNLLRYIEGQPQAAQQPTPSVPARPLATSSNPPAAPAGASSAVPAAPQVTPSPGSIPTAT